MHRQHTTKITSDASYQLALKLIAHIDRRLARGVYYRDKAGNRLYHLDQVLAALSRGDLAA